VLGCGYTSCTDGPGVYGEAPGMCNYLNDELLLRKISREKHSGKLVFFLKKIGIKLQYLFYPLHAHAE
jgi:hypothetical protein